MLSRVAGAAIGSPTDPTATRSSTIGALDGAEIVARTEIVAGRADLLPALLPSFIFLVTLPAVGKEEALRLSRRTEELLREGN